jgi:molybdate transport system ATP-binding protein
MQVAVEYAYPVGRDCQASGFSLVINTQVPAKGVTAVYGPSGCGKTTLLRCLAGLVHADFCQFKVGGLELSHLPSVQRQLGYVFQEDRLFPHLSVIGNLNFAHKRRFSDNGPSLQQVVEWLDIAQLLKRMPSQLSGGQKQRVAIARALLTAPQCLLLDEPLAGVDSQSRHSILQHLESLADTLNIPMLYVSHNLDEITRLADHLIIMEEGRLVAAGPLLEIVSRLELGLARQEHAAVVLHANVVRHDDDYCLSQLSWGLPHQVEGISGPLLTVGRLSANLGDNVRVRIPCRDVSISLEKPHQSSILNVLSGVIVGIELIDGARAMVKVDVHGQFILARITRKSLESLLLEKGQSVYLQIKTVALLSELTA